MSGAIVPLVLLIALIGATIAYGAWHAHPTGGSEVTDFAVEQPAASDDGPPEWSPADSVLDKPAGQSTPGKPVIRPKPAPMPLPPVAAIAVAMLTRMAALGLWLARLLGLPLRACRRVARSVSCPAGWVRTRTADGAAQQRHRAPGPNPCLQIPTIGLTQVIVKETSSDDLASGPGHLPTTPLPGQAGNSRICGRNVASARHSATCTSCGRA